MIKILIDSKFLYAHLDAYERKNEHIDSISIQDSNVYLNLSSGRRMELCSRGLAIADTPYFDTSRVGWDMLREAVRILPEQPVVVEFDLHTNLILSF